MCLIHVPTTKENFFFVKMQIVIYYYSCVGFLNWELENTEYKKKWTLNRLGELRRVCWTYNVKTLILAKSQASQFKEQRSNSSLSWVTTVHSNSSLNSGFLPPYIAKQIYPEFLRTCILSFYILPFFSSSWIFSSATAGGCRT